MTTVNPAASPVFSTSSTNTDAASIGEDFNTFLELLVSQVQNQDPLEPVDSTQFVEQLATFSALEQQVQTNTSLNAIGQLMTDLYQIVATDAGEPSES